MTTETRFWTKVDRAGGPDACWPWTAATFHFGHGQFWNGRRTVVASRFAYELLVGPIPVGLFILHSCDNPPCCNPAHLRPGTQAENIEDRDSRGRWSPMRGAANGGAKLSEQGARIVRDLFESYPITQAALGRLVGVSQTAVSSIVRGITYAEAT